MLGTAGWGTAGWGAAGWGAAGWAALPRGTMMMVRRAGVEPFLTPRPPAPTARRTFARRPRGTLPRMFFRKGKGGGKARSGPQDGELQGDSAEVGSTQFLTGDSGIDRRTVQILLEAIAQVSEARDLESLLVDIVDRSIELTGAERGLLLLDGPDGVLLVRVARSKDRRTIDDDLRFSTSIARRAFDQLEPVRTTVQSDSEALELGRSVFDLKLRAVMCVPLARQGQAGKPQGVLYVDSRAATRQFSRRDLGLFAALAQHISIALINAKLHLDSLEKVRLQQNVDLASAIQRDLMPAATLSLPGYETAGWYRAAEGTAGDFYDVVRARGGRIALVVGDVTGHGIGPALITASAQAGLRSYLRLVEDPGDVVTLLNQDLCERIEDGRFLTLFLGLLSPDGSLRTLNAGHPAALHWRAREKRCVALPRHGPALGMVPDEHYTADDLVRLEPGDLLIAVSDGLLEARAPDRPEGFLGEDGLVELVRRSQELGRSARETALDLAEAALAHGGGKAEDDITLLVVKRLGAG